MFEKKERLEKFDDVKEAFEKFIKKTMKLVEENWSVKRQKLKKERDSEHNEDLEKVHKLLF